MYHIGEISLIAIVVNMLVLPMVPTAMLLTFLTGLLGFFSLTLASIVGYLASLSLLYILVIAKWMAAVPFASVTVPQFSFVSVGLLYGLMLAGWFYYKWKKAKRSDLLDGWTIETETADMGLRVGSKSVSAEATELPVFFR